MKKIILMNLIVLVLINNLFSKQNHNKKDKPKYFVSDFIGQNIDKKVLQLANDTFKYQLSQNKKIEIYDINNLDIKSDGTNDIQNLNDKNYLIELCKQNKIDFIIINELSLKDKNYQVIIQIINIETGNNILNIKKNIVSNINIVKFYEKLAKEILKIKNYDSIIEIFSKNFSIIPLEMKYKKVISIIKSSDFKSYYSNNKDYAFLYGFLNGNFKADYTYYSFDKEILTNIYLIIEIKKKTNKNLFNELEKKIEKYIGTPAEKKDNEIIWIFNDNSLVLKKDNINNIDSIIVHFYKNDNKDDFAKVKDNIIKSKEFLKFKESVDISIGGEIIGFSKTKFYNFKKEFYTNNVLEKTRYSNISGEINFYGINFGIPLSFCYSLDENNWLGGFVIPSYSISFLTEKNLIYNNEFTFSLGLKYKRGDKSIKKMGTIELGAIIDFEYFVAKHNSYFSFDNYRVKLYLPVMHLAAGPVLYLGFQNNHKGTILDWGFYYNSTFGLSSYDGKEFDTKSLNININGGLFFRIGYNKSYYLKGKNY